MDNLITGLCEKGLFLVAFKLALRRFDEGLTNESTYKKTVNWIENYEIEGKAPMEEKPKKSRAADMAKSRANAKGLLVQTRLTEKATSSLESLCEEWKMTKTEVINKLLEEQEQRQLL